MSPDSVGIHYLTTARAEVHRYRQLCEKAMAQVEDDKFFSTLDDDSNSLAVLVKHMAGNLHSRWRDFLTTDGEKPDRDRDSEFVIDGRDSRGRLMARWAEGWDHLESTLEALGPDDLLAIVEIRREPHTVLLAIERAVAHLAYHAGQIVQLSRHFRGGDWQSLSVPRGQSEEFNRRMREKHAAGKS